jgi:hypothetical protein
MTPFRFQKLGVIPYQRTGTELRVGQAAAPVFPPPTYDDQAFFSQPILMQGLSPECGGYSLAFLLAYLLNQQQKLSGSFAYAYEKTQDGVPDSDGTTINAIGKAAQNEGTCLDNLFPDDGVLPAPSEGQRPTLFSVATPQAIQDALTRAGLIPLFLTDLSWNGLQTAISKYKAVIVEAQVGDEWYTNAAGETSWAAADVLPIRPPKKIIDAHFFVLGGKYDPTDIYFANSWSAEWAQNGFGYLQQNYVPFIKNAIILYKAPPSVTTIQNHPTLSQPEKLSLIQQIIDDIEQEVGLISQEIGQI